MVRKIGEKSKNKEISIDTPIDRPNNLKDTLGNLSNILGDLKEKYGLSLEDIKGLVEKEKKENAIPIEIFNRKLSVLESVVKYLKENFSLSFSEIAKQLGRNYQTVYATYVNSKKKFPRTFSFVPTKLPIPISVFKKERLSALEALVKFLKETRNLRYIEIAKLLKRDQRTIWTVYQRAKIKLGENERRK